MISVGAVSFDTPDVIESYSSRPKRRTTKSSPTSSRRTAPQHGFINPFCGTSESTPYTTGAAALVLSAKPKLTPAQLAAGFDRTRSHLAAQTPIRPRVGPPRPGPPARSSGSDHARVHGIASRGNRRRQAVAARGADPGSGRATLTSNQHDLDRDPRAGRGPGGAGATLTCNGGPTQTAPWAASPRRADRDHRCYGRHPARDRRVAAGQQHRCLTSSPRTSAFAIAAISSPPISSASCRRPCAVTLAATSGSPALASTARRMSMLALALRADRSTSDDLSDGGRRPGSASLAYRPSTDLPLRRWPPGAGPEATRRAGPPGHGPPDNGIDAAIETSAASPIGLAARSRSPRSSDPARCSVVRWPWVSTRTVALATRTWPG